MSDRISDLLDERCVALSLEGRRKEHLLDEMVDLLAAADKVTDAAAVRTAVRAREKETSTALGGGIAMPHCLSAAVPAPALAFGRKPEGAKFDAIDRRPVRLFFMIVAPENAQSEHLRILSKLARYLHDEELKAALLSAQSPAAVVELFRQREKHQRR